MRTETSRTSEAQMRIESLVHDVIATRGVHSRIEPPNETPRTPSKHKCRTPSFLNAFRVRPTLGDREQGLRRDVDRQIFRSLPPPPGDA